MAYPHLTDKAGALATALAIRTRKLSVAEAVDAAITRAGRLDAEINAIAVPDFDRASETARAMDNAPRQLGQPLFGVPMTIKESFDVAGLPTTWGHPRFQDMIAPKDALLVRRLKAAGAIIIGKTNVPVDLTDWQSFNPVYGRTSNPHSPDRSPGGSSGGSAAAVASGIVPCDYGTDIGGSVRVPAHLCGVWGHKTTWGLVPKHGHDFPGQSRSEGFIAAADGPLSIAGPLARNPQDLAVLVEVGAEVPLRRRTKPLAECRLLAISSLPGAPVDGSVLGPTEAALEALARTGVRIDRASDMLPDQARHYRSYLKMMNIIMSGGAPAPDGTRATASDWFALMNAQAACIAEWEVLFETYDFVLAPPAPVLAVPHSDTAVFRGKLMVDGKEEPGSCGLVWSGMATFPGLPSTVLPIGSGTYLGAELPCGMQVIGPRWSDLDCIAAAEAIGNILHS
ncbi:MAG: amidase family protein [Erythrobacter sp.]